jgi:DNA mismatch endonuclease (patch repair protein)
MADVMTAAQRSQVMSRNRGKDSGPELRLAELLIAGGLSFDRHDPSVPGKPDFVFHKAQVAVFVDGDFWHGWRFPIWQHRMAPFWRKKIDSNRSRDRRNFRRLRHLGWKVLRVWEHQVETDAVQCVKRIADVAGQPLDLPSVETRHGMMPQIKRRKRLPKP